METALCIHGHFYQPPREDPWLGSILSEASAAPMRDWNERILRESYAPMAWARRMDGAGRISDIVNCYEWMSFNTGPTLFQWMRYNAPEVIQRMQKGDANSLARWGHGNAIAQIYHHVIMPLATPEDRELEVAWAIEDFRRVFAREPEGMWLSEAAVDLPSLESLAGRGITFVILAPRQAKAVIDGKAYSDVNEDSLYIGEPYLVRLPSGNSITAVFYNGRVSRAIAFESLLSDGERFWGRIAEEASHMGREGVRPLLTLATDGETYGHHFKFGEMALAHVLAQGYTRRDGIRLTNLAAHIAANPPQKEVILHEPSSWSCVHGVERWRSDCGCTDGGHPGWNQKWRAPLRKALNRMRSAVEAHFATAGPECLNNPRRALMAYGEVLAEPASRQEFAQKWIRKTGDRDDCYRADRAWKILAAQEQALAAFASCAWFFDDVARIEPENAMTFALRAMDLIRETGGLDMREDFLKDLDAAVSNQTGMGSGRDVFFKDVAPRRGNAAAECLLALLLIGVEGRWPAGGGSALCQWPMLSVEITPEDALPRAVPGNLFPRPDYGGSLRGKAVVRQFFEDQGAEYAWEFIPPSEENVAPFVSLRDASVEIQAAGGSVVRCAVQMLSKPMRDYLLARMAESLELRSRARQRALARHFLSALTPWPEEQHDIISPELYHGLMPYVAMEFVLDEGDKGMDDAARAQAASLLSARMDNDGRLLAGRLVRDVLKGRLSGTIALADDERENTEDAVMAAMVRRARAVLPDIDLWEVQNMLWEEKISSFPHLADALGFHV